MLSVLRNSKETSVAGAKWTGREEKEMNLEMLLGALV